MKKIIPFILIFAAFQTKAQIFSEDFNAGIPSTFTLTDGDGLTPNNTNYTVGSFASSNLTSSAGIAEDCAVSISWFNPIACCADDWMVTPSITIPNSTNPIALTFNAITYEAAYPDGVEVYVSTTGTSPSDFLSTTAIYNTTPTTPGPVSTPIAGNGENDVWTIRSVDMSSYAGQTIYIAFRNNSNDMNILGIDDIIVKELQDNEATLSSLDITPYSAAPANINISGVVTNSGGNTITALDITWADGTNSYTDNLSVNITPGSTYNFTHSDQLSMTSAGNANISVTIDMVNSSVDPDMSNNSLAAIATVLTSIPEKITVGEEKTGSWCGWCPRGAVALAEMESTSSFIGIAVHNADPMTISSYDGSLGAYVPGGYPGGGVDRVLTGDPGDFSTMHASRVTKTVPCGVNSITAYFDGNTNKISVSTEIEAFGDMNGDFRLSCVIVEDDLESTSSGWAQSNYYAPGQQGNGTPMNFPANVNNGFSFNTASTSEPCANFEGYDHVARSLSSDDILGDVGSLPSGTVTIGTHNYTFAAVDITSLVAYNDAGFNWAKAHAVVMIINATTGEILNAQEEALTSNLSAPSWDCDGQENCSDPGTGNGAYNSLSACEAACVSTNVNETNSSLTIYPNPVKDILIINGDYNSVDIYDIYGKEVLSSDAKQTINVSSLASGIYMLNINTENKIQTQKITIAK